MKEMNFQIGEYQIKFDRKNLNVILFHKGNKLVYMLTCPPIDKGCDIINFDDKLSKGYTFNFDGLILITTKEERKLYYKGDLVDLIKR